MGTLVLFLGNLDQRSYKGLVSNATEILDKFSFKEISEFSGINKLMHPDLKVHCSSLLIMCKQI